MKIFHFPGSFKPADPCISPGLLLMVLVLFLEFPGNDGSMSEADEPSYNEDGKW
ncbi:hypothetical protein E1A91_D13G095200v1 [Gossypium mustelinum]|uniref:Uncharacterized protein n=1 Tax=Gossypium mustelinum TaxID=34275 RepID=A0A5D2RZY1_GOSMU|nr:hypothetical protein E1A91_D13G095200v1 [Gossypium mustelinum]